MVKPVFRAIRSVVKLVLFEFPTLVYKHVLKPVWEKTKVAWKWMHENVFMPIYDAIAKIAKAIFVEMPRWINQNILVPLHEHMRARRIWMKENVFDPLYQSYFKNWFLTMRFF